MKFSKVSSLGEEQAYIYVSHAWARVFRMSLKGTLPPTEWTPLLKQAIAHVGTQGAERLNYRLIEGSGFEVIVSVLRELGFSRGVDRIEYRAQIAELPAPQGDLLQWRAVLANGEWSIEKLAEFVRDLRTDDPDFDSGEDPVGYMDDWLDNPELIAGPQCIEIGFLGSEPVTLVVAQVEAATGWSRISYMGVVRELRGQGLGVHVHRRGFAMMRAQGGILYHGGTWASNTAMRRLFERHGCKELRKMQEWTWKGGAR